MSIRSEAVWQEVVHLVAAFEALLTALDRMGDSSARELARLLGDGMRSGREAVAAGRDGAWPVGLLAGLRQGARDLPNVLALLPEHERAVAAAEVDAAGGSWLAALVRGTARRSAAIAKRGQIRSEDEYHCVRERVDQLEHQGAEEAKLRPLYTLLDQYPDEPVNPRSTGPAS